MRKLLFFVLLLLVSLSIQSFAWNYGCGENIPPSVCGADGSGNGGGSGGTVPTYYGGIAINPYTRKFHSAWYYQNGEEAESAALKGCGVNSCVSTWGSSSYISIAISEDEKNWGYGASDSQSEAWNKAIAMCQKSGKACYVALVGYPDQKARYVYWGGVSYNAQTGSTGKTSNGLRKAEAENTVLQNAGCSKNTECYSYSFQYAYGALAKNESNQVFSGSSNKSLKDAEKQAEKNCKKESGAKQCKALVSSEKESKK